jgi:hypothetical protein
MLSKEALNEFIDIYRAEFGEDISEESALEQAVALLSLMNITYQPLKKEWLSC